MKRDLLEKLTIANALVVLHTECMPDNAGYSGPLKTAALSWIVQLGYETFWVRLACLSIGHKAGECIIRKMIKFR